MKNRFTFKVELLLCFVIWCSLSSSISVLLRLHSVVQLPVNPRTNGIGPQVRVTGLPKKGRWNGKNVEPEKKIEKKKKKVKMLTSMLSIMWHFTDENEPTYSDISLGSFLPVV